MTAASDELYRTIETKYFASKDNWGDLNTSLPGGQQLQSVVEVMVKEKFGGYTQPVNFTIGTEHYYAYVLAPQNKHSRSDHAYGDNSFAGAESYVNLMIKEKGTKTVKLNLHILLRTLAAEARAQRALDRRTPDADGFIQQRKR
jgi:hypothetical protein